LSLRNFYAKGVSKELSKMEKSTSAQVIVAVIPIVGIVMGSIVVFFHLLWSHRQKVLLIQAKQWTGSRFNLRVFSLLAGLFLFCVGLCLTVFLGMWTGKSMGLLGGIIPLASGLALLLFFLLSRKIRL